MVAPHHTDQLERATATAQVHPRRRLDLIPERDVDEGPTPGYRLVCPADELVQYRPGRVEDRGALVSPPQTHRPVGHGYRGVDHTRC